MALWYFEPIFTDMGTETYFGLSLNLNHDLLPFLQKKAVWHSRRLVRLLVSLSRIRITSFVRSGAFPSSLSQFPSRANGHPSISLSFSFFLSSASETTLSLLLRRCHDRISFRAIFFYSFLFFSLRRSACIFVYIFSVVSNAKFFPYFSDLNLLSFSLPQPARTSLRPVIVTKNSKCESFEWFRCASGS